MKDPSSQGTPSRGTPFGQILREAVEQTPGAIGGAFAACDGETVDSFSSWAHDDWAMLTAHYGIVLAQVNSALHTFHYGSATQLTLHHERIDLLIELVGEGYFALLALEPPSSLAHALNSLGAASVRLREEMQ